MNGICPFAIWLPGPEAKTGYDGQVKTHLKVGVTLHTMEYESTPTWNDATTLYNALFSGREASWTFSICRFMNGSILYQHYPLDAVCWAQGYAGNLWLIGIEHEGIAPEKLSEAQYELLTKLLRWIKEELGWADWRGIGNRQTKLVYGVDGWLFEHNAVPGAPPTDCQVFTRQMIDPERLLRDLREEDMDEVRVREIAYEQAQKALKDARLQSLWKHPNGDFFQLVGRLRFRIPDPEAFVGSDFDWDDARLIPTEDYFWQKYVPVG